MERGCAAVIISETDYQGACSVASCTVVMPILDSTVPPIVFYLLCTGLHDELMTDMNWNGSNVFPIGTPSSQQLTSGLKPNETTKCRVVLLISGWLMHAASDSSKPCR